MKRKFCPGMTGCPFCRGTGVIVTESVCSGCDGEGRAHCPMCDNDDAECRSCAGSGKINDERECQCADRRAEMGGYFDYLERTSNGPS